jgi:hypothetical protein
MRFVNKTRIKMLFSTDKLMTIDEGNSADWVC